eukprot:Tbor_TRINITY_DN5431_c2_g1::TRINITY_DN5431_c2_g1_i1::g.24784::m.24784/K02156/AUB, PIWI; aubergine
MSGRGGRGGGPRGRGGRPDAHGEVPYGGRGNQEVKAEVLKIATIRSSTLVSPPSGSKCLMPHLFGGMRSQGLNVGSKDQDLLTSSKNSVTEALSKVRDLKCGKEGKAKEVTTNLFPVSILQDKAVYQYAVSVEPICPNPSLRTNIVRQALKGKKSLIIRRNILYSSEKLHSTSNEVVAQYNPPKDAKGSSATARVVKLSFTNAIAAEKNGGLSTEQYTLFSSLLAEAFGSTGVTKIAGVYYDLNNNLSEKLVYTDVDHGPLILTSGLRLVLLPAAKGLLMNADITTRVTRECSILEELENIKKNCRSDKWKVIVKEELEGMVAATNYLRESRTQTFRITEVCFDLKPTDMIPPMPGGDPSKSKRSFKQYVKDHLDITLKCDDQPLLKCVSSTEKYPDGSPVVRYFIPELSRFVGQTKKMRANRDLQVVLKKKCLISSTERFNRIFEIVNKMVEHPAFKSVANAWGVTINPKFIVAPARELNDVTLLDGNNATIPQKGRKWLIKRGMKIAKSSSPPDVWVCVYPDSLEYEIGEFVKCLMRDTINGLGAGWPEPQWHPYKSGREDERNFQTIEKNILPSIDERAKFVLFVLPSDNEKNYLRVKMETLRTWAIPSQCVLFKNVKNTKNHMNVSSRVGGQMLVKQGGALWDVKTKELPNAVICAVDFAKGGQKDHITVGLVAVSKGFRYVGEYTETYKGTAGVAISKIIKSVVTDYRALHKTNPSEIVLYRSGMDEGDVPRIVHEEVIPIQKECDAAGIKLCVIASLKRTHTRVLSCESGTVIDTDVLPQTGFSFLMVPQHVNIGTATAMKFSVLCNNISLIEADVLETLTFQLCHSFYGWWATTREPSVVMYAQRLAELGHGLGGKIKAKTGGFLVF